MEPRTSKSLRRRRRRSPLVALALHRRADAVSPPLRHRPASPGPRSACGRPCTRRLSRRLSRRRCGFLWLPHWDRAAAPSAHAPSRGPPRPPPGRVPAARGACAVGAPARLASPVRVLASGPGLQHPLALPAREVGSGDAGLAGAFGLSRHGAEAERADVY
uniref:Uncharacterized protein n=1 Tax=Rangifer tarandus platyrhynchus TaxID=3082113 RepID=A0ACB0FPV2_RANTA|nr:unnamed protein product [Rangifer tarandus platyrhynchus]